MSSWLQSPVGRGLRRLVPGAVRPPVIPVVRLAGTIGFGAPLRPALTLWFDLDPAEAARRRAQARAADRFEAEDLDFFARVRAAYAARAAAEPQRFARIDAGQDLDAVAAEVQRVLQERGW